MAWHGMAWHSTAQHSIAWHSIAKHSINKTSKSLCTKKLVSERANQKFVYLKSLPAAASHQTTRPPDHQTTRPPGDQATRPPLHYIIIRNWTTRPPHHRATNCRFEVPQPTGGDSKNPYWAYRTQFLWKKLSEHFIAIEKGNEGNRLKHVLATIRANRSRIRDANVRSKLAKRTWF